jgi:SAM-dependent methyltransferase
MRTVNSSVPRWQTAAARVAVLIIVIQVLGLRAGWSQEPVQPRINEEFLEQEKIYRSRGAEGRRVYTTDRGLSRYADLLPSTFCDALGRLGSSDRWLDIGAGQAQAILDYHLPENAAAPAENCRGSGPRARAVAISIEDRRTENWKQQVARLSDDRIRYLHGKRLRQYSPEELGKFQIITDVYGGFTYTEDLSQFVDKVLRLLEVGGSFYTLATGVHLEDGTDKLGTLYLTELEDPFGREVKMCSWLKKISCLQVTCESKSELKRPTQLIKIQKVCSDTSVPRMKLVEFEAGYPPERCFQLDP